MDTSILEDAIKKAIDQWTGCSWNHSLHWSTHLPDADTALEGSVNVKGLRGDEDIRALTESYIPYFPTPDLRFQHLSQTDQLILRLAIQEVAACGVAYAQKCKQDAEDANQYGKKALRALKASEFQQVISFLASANQLELQYGDNPVWDEPSRIAMSWK